MSDQRLFPLIAWSSENTAWSAIFASRLASSVSRLDTMLLGGGFSSSSSAHAHCQLPDAARPSLTVPPRLASPLLPSCSSCKNACSCAMFRTVSCFERSMFRSRAFSIAFAVFPNFFPNLAVPSIHRRTASSEISPMTSDGSLNAVNSSSGSNGRSTPCVDTRSRIIVSCAVEDATRWKVSGRSRKAQMGGVTYEPMIIHLLLASTTVLRVRTRLVELPARTSHVRSRRLMSRRRRTRNRRDLRV